LSFLPHLK
jgi:hypothetical protein